MVVFESVFNTANFSPVARTLSCRVFVNCCVESYLSSNKTVGKCNSVLSSIRELDRNILVSVNIE